MLITLPQPRSIYFAHFDYSFQLFSHVLSTFSFRFKYIVQCSTLSYESFIRISSNICHSFQHFNHCFCDILRSFYFHALFLASCVYLLLFFERFLWQAIFWTAHALCAIHIETKYGAFDFGRFMWHNAVHLFELCLWEPCGI